MNDVHLKFEPWSLSQKAYFSKQSSTHRSEIKYELPHSQVHPSFSRKEDRTSPASGQRQFEHQYFIAKTNYIAVYKSHRAVCSFIEVVQNTYGTASPPSRRGGDSPRVGRHGAEGVLVPREGALGRGRQEAAPASGSQELPSCASWAVPPEGTRGWRSSVPATLTPKQPLPHQAQPLPPTPAPGAGEGTMTTQELRQMGNRKDLLE